MVEWRRSSRGARAPVVRHGWHRGGPTRPGHARRRLGRRQLTGGGAPVADGLGERAREVQHDEAKAVVHVAVAVGAWSGEDAVAVSWSRRPWRTAARERGERERERAGSGEGDGEGVLVPLLIGSRAQGAWH